MTSPISASSILERYEAGERSFQSLDLDEMTYDFSGTTLAGADFTDCFIFGNFRGANLAHAIFKDANVKTCDFTGANLEGASFEGAAIDAAIFTDANLTGTSFLGASESGHRYVAGELPFKRIG